MPREPRYATYQIAFDFVEKEWFDLSMILNMKDQTLRLIFNGENIAIHSDSINFENEHYHMAISMAAATLEIKLTDFVIKQR